MMSTEGSEALELTTLYHQQANELDTAFLHFSVEATEIWSKNSYPKAQALSRTMQLLMCQPPHL